MGTVVTIRIPKVYVNSSPDTDDVIYIDPIGLMFLISFAGLLFIQFLAMLWHRSRQAWDAAKETPRIADELKPRKLLSFIQIIICTLVGILVFAFAFFSKTSLLLLINLSSHNTRSIVTKPFVLLFIGCLLIAPSILMLIKCIWKITFKDSKTPSTQTLIWVVLVETMVALGSSILTMIVMPRFDILTNVMLLNGVAISSAILQVVTNAKAHGQKRFISTSLAAVVFLIAGYVFFIVNYLRADSNWRVMVMYLGLAITGTVLVSLNWWENYATLFSMDFFQNTIRDIKRSRNLVGIVSSLVRIVVTFIVLGAYVKLSDQDWSSVKSVKSSSVTIVLSLFSIQIICSAVCRWLAVAACKMHAVRRSFIVPLILTSPAVLVAFFLAIYVPFLNFQSKVIHSHTHTHTHTHTHIPFLLYFPSFHGTFFNYCQNFWRVSNSKLNVMNYLLTDLTRSFCNQTAYANGTTLGYSLMGMSLASWWVGLVLCTLYIWFLNTQRIARTADLFVRSLYEAAFIDQSVLLNVKFQVPDFKHNREREKMTIYICATMWHETWEEMMTMIISIFRLDKFRPKKNQFNDVSFEFHIYFDDAFITKDNKRCVNEYAETLVEVIKEVYEIFSNDTQDVFEESKSLPEQKIMQTPYGCRLQYNLPHGNTLLVHYKDKHQIRHKKRWSQIMYMYYLLGWKLHSIYYDMYKEGDELLCNVEELLEQAKANTYILALDGDIDFQPSAVMLLVDRLRLYPEVGAACGRIHPTGTGPMVWYQKFEYAVGHWLQKTAEHVFGSVLCSPGCFSLMRASALMDDNVMKRYTTKPTEAAHYVQYDQGEDRWLCTLMLQQGWRVEYNAASDSYTNAPQEFKEFYNQRRRWGPSTMANTLDLLSSGTVTAQANKSISRLYILYQTITMAASILGPASVCLMIAGSFKFVFKIDANVALVLAVLPPAIYMALCYYLRHTNSDTQINIAAFMSILYAFLMIATIFSVIGEMVVQQTFITPSGLFFIGIITMYTFTALLHPKEFHLIIYGLLYVVGIPSGYLLLAIYSMVNMNNVSWGTRESNQAAGSDEKRRDVKCQKLVKLVCGYSLEFQLKKDEKVTSKPELDPLLPSAVEPETKSTCKSKDGQTTEVEDYFIEQLKQISGELPLRMCDLSEDEETFWEDLIDQYLKPLKTDKAKEERLKADLQSLRNKATFVFFISNALWIVATFFLQAMGTSVTIRIPKVYVNSSSASDSFIYIDPIGLMFLLSCLGLLVIQFLAMLWHRLQTLIHFIAYNGTEAVGNNKARQQNLAMNYL
ncbi:chitin synthase chs-2-like [Trichomycterus rosablanca]|uniref:chitin synthase chs-2-like n=1 Tax=Trichomycterus rosablanca TaxID=2290929 RepID=UPI002F3610B8